MATSVISGFHTMSWLSGILNKAQVTLGAETQRGRSLWGSGCGLTMMFPACGSPWTGSTDTASLSEHWAQKIDAHITCTRNY